jgi:hypothetical protein
MILRRLGFVLVLGALALGVAACGGGGTGDSNGGNDVTFALDEQHGSGLSGESTLIEDSGRLTVTVSLDGDDSGTARPAHIHSGTCDSPGPAVHPLDNVVDGSSETVLEATLSSVQDGNHSVDVHASAADIDTDVACGDIPLAGDDNGDGAADGLGDTGNETVVTTETGTETTG